MCDISIQVVGSKTHLTGDFKGSCSMMVIASPCQSRSKEKRFQLGEKIQRKYRKRAISTSTFMVRGIGSIKIGKFCSI
jgi:hypothetical protein